MLSESRKTVLPELHRCRGEQLGLERKHVRMMTMDLPEAKGTYVLIASVAQMKRLEIGRLGAYDIVPGFYAYVSSAFGASGIRARIGHHLESTTCPHRTLIICSRWQNQSRFGTRRQIGNSSTIGLNCWKRRHIFVCRFPGLVRQIITAVDPVICFIRSADRGFAGLNRQSWNSSRISRRCST